MLVNLERSQKERQYNRMWRSRPPHRLDFVTDIEMFLPASWQYILYGMEFRTDLEPMRAMYTRFDAAQREFAMIRTMSEHATADLPDHRALVEHLCARDAGRAGDPMHAPAVARPMEQLR